MTHVAAHPPLKGISSMATRQLLAELATEFTRRTGRDVHIESVGGVDAAKRVQAGEVFDVVFLAADALGKLELGGHLLMGSVVDLVHSGVAVAVQAGTAWPDLSSAASVKQAVLQAPSVSYSTGPSGVALLKMFEAWGILPAIQDRLKQAPAGVPVGALVAQGQAALGFQQLSELIHVPGITIAGPLPDEIQINTTFSGAIGVHSAQVQAVRELLNFLTSTEADAAKRRQGMSPV
jgi:molybdate transport system substrate-binding protein